MTAPRHRCLRSGRWWRLGALALLLSAEAVAAECPEPDLDHQRVIGAVEVAEAALDQARIEEASEALNALGASLACLDDPVDRAAFARFARAMALVAFYQQEEALVVRWGTASKLADPDLSWELPPDNPFRALVERAPIPPVGGPQGKSLALPRRGAVYLNGGLLTEPVAHAEVPGFVQVFDGRQRLVGAYWQDGAAFPEAILTEASAPAGPAGRAPRGEPLSDLPVVPLAVSGGFALTSVVTYALAGAAQASLPDQTTPNGLTRTRSRANALALVSGLAAAGAVGVGVGGVLLSPEGLRVRVDF